MSTEIRFRLFLDRGFDQSNEVRRALGLSPVGEAAARPRVDYSVDRARLSEVLSGLESDTGDYLVKVLVHRRPDGAS